MGDATFILRQIECGIGADLVIWQNVGHAYAVSTNSSEVIAQKL